MNESLKPLKWYKDLAGAAERREAGCFLVEGERAVRQIAGLHPESVREVLATEQPSGNLRQYPFRLLTEKQFRLFFERAEQKKGVTGTNLLVMLECRLDNIAFRLGFANSRNQARHFVRHGHFNVNGRRVDIPSYLVRVGDVVELREASRKIQAVTDALDAVVRRGVPQWLELEKDQIKGIVKSLPEREDLTMPMQEQLVVELYSK
jgi:small subunit ribosomal protein S4